MTKERLITILQEIYPELYVFIQESYNLIDPKHDFDKYFNALNNFLIKLKSIENITEEEIRYISDNMNNIYFNYTDYLQGGHGDYNKIERRLYMQTPSISQKWKEFFIK